MLERSHATRRIAAALTVVAVAALAACGRSDPQSLTQSGRSYIEKNDAKSAIIELKQALQGDPGLGEARLLLGRALLLSGDPVAAEVEFRKALDGGQPPAEVVPDLARAMLAQGQYKAIITQYGQTTLSSAQSEVDLRVTLARAYAASGDRDKASDAVQAALRAKPDHGPAILMAARVQADAGKVDEALAAVDAYLGKAPSDAEAWQLRGELLAYGKRDLDKALVDFKKAAELKPDLVSAHTGAMVTLLAQRKVEEARAQLVPLKKALPNHPQTLFFEANLLLMDKQFDKAREITQQLLRVAPENPRVLQLAGAVEYELRSYGQAESHLAKALQLAPDFDVARRLLGLTYLRTSQPAKAVAVLAPLTDRPQADSTAFSLLAQAHLQSGDLNEAEKAFKKAAELDPKDPTSKTALAVSKVLRGDSAGGLAELQSLASASEATTADLPLIGTLIRQRDFAGALKAIDALEAKQPKEPIAANLRGRVKLLQGDRAAAEQAFEQALKIRPGFYPAAAALAQLALSRKDPARARAIIDEALKADPSNTQALLASLALKARVGTSPLDVAKSLNEAIKRQPSDASLRLALIEHHLHYEQPGPALDAALRAQEAIPNNPALLDALGRAQAAHGETLQAIGTYGKLAQMMPSSAAPLLRSAEVHWRTGDKAAAEQDLKRALALDPNNMGVQRLLIDVYLSRGQRDLALAQARNVQKRLPDRDVGFLLEGGIEAASKNHDRALAAFRTGLKVASKSTELATRVHSSLIALKQDADAAKFAADWLKSNPDDAGFNFYLGDAALARGEFDQAEMRYREVARLQPENALALNNVAWLMARAGKPGAVAMAEKADQLLPDRPVIMDTLATALVAEGQAAKALDVMQRAVELAPDNLALRLNLARVMIKAGDRANARVELQKLAKLGDKFPQQKEVAQLLSTL